MSNSLHKKLFVILAILIGLAVNVFLIGTATFYRSTLAATPVEIFFTPDTVSIPPDTIFKLMLDPKGQTISALSIRIFFDPTKLQLSSDAFSSNSSLFIYSSPTPMSEANSTGNIELVLLQRPGTTAPNKTFEIARCTEDLSS